MIVPTNEQLLTALSQYPDALNSRAQASLKHSSDLIQLDTWFHDELPPLLATREPSYLTQAELGRVMEYKLARGKWRPKLLQLVTTNSDSAVQDITRQASSILLNNDNDNDSSDSGSAQERPRPRARPQPRGQDRNNPAAQLSRAESALNMLCTLKGVGPATASLLLSLLTDPRTLKPPLPSSSNSSSVQPFLLREPFMSDESFAIVLPSAKADYTLKSWREWRKAMALRINEQVNGTRIWLDMAQLERACYAWTWYKVETRTRDEDVESPARSSELKYESKEMKRKRGGEIRDKGHDEAQVDTSDKKGKRARR